MRRFWAIGCLALAAALAGCAPPPEAKVFPVVIDNLAYAPTTVTAHVGDTVQWINKDLFEHSATASDASFDVNLLPNASGQVVLSRAGVISYICRFHPGMKGQIVVQK